MIKLRLRDQGVMRTIFLESKFSPSFFNIEDFSFFLFFSFLECACLYVEILCCNFDAGQTRLKRKSHKKEEVKKKRLKKRKNRGWKSQ